MAYLNKLSELKPRSGRNVTLHFGDGEVLFMHNGEYTVKYQNTCGIFSVSYSTFGTIFYDKFNRIEFPLSLLLNKYNILWEYAD